MVLIGLPWGDLEFSGSGGGFDFRVQSLRLSGLGLVRYGSGHMHCPLDQDLQLRYPKLWHVSCDKSLNRGLIWRTTHVLQHQILLLCLGRVGGRWKGSFVLLISKITQTLYCSSFCCVSCFLSTNNAPSVQTFPDHAHHSQRM